MNNVHHTNKHVITHMTPRAQSIRDNIIRHTFFDELLDVNADDLLLIHNVHRDDADDIVNSIRQYHDINHDDDESILLHDVICDHYHN